MTDQLTVEVDVKNITDTAAAAAARTWKSSFIWFRISETSRKHVRQKVAKLFTHFHSHFYSGKSLLTATFYFSGALLVGAVFVVICGSDQKY